MRWTEDSERVIQEYKRLGWFCSAIPMMDPSGEPWKDDCGGTLTKHSESSRGSLCQSGMPLAEAEDFMVSFAMRVPKADE